MFSNTNSIHHFNCVIAYLLQIVSRKIVSLGFEPRSAGPEPTMMDHYTKRLASTAKDLSFFN